MLAVCRHVALEVHIAAGQHPMCRQMHRHLSLGLPGFGVFRQLEVVGLASHRFLLERGCVALNRRLQVERDVDGIGTDDGQHGRV